ncbi:MAG TPA: 1,4-dihydroxy-2-naphthoate octaprenyltransferase [Casimicrobiaceae bacterium]|nr:1,4-dihydroxy-2-naphthoate octaprenyltransferase [Casimicrobiaceae bacterium]
MHAPPAPNAPPLVRAGSWQAWQIALRPRTFWIATIPVIVGSALVLAEQGSLDIQVAILSLLASLLLQAITNLQNDVGYAARRVQTGNHVGWSRATCNGWLSSRDVRTAIGVAIIAVLAVGWPVVLRAGWPAAVMGASSILAALAYMGGPRPIAFTPLGELTVFVFFGLVAVIGSYYVQAGMASATVILAAIGIGALAAAVLAVNNHRDRGHDASTGRRTFVVTFGAGASRTLFESVVLIAFAVLPVMAWIDANAWLALPLVVLPSALGIRRDFGTLPIGPAWNELLFRTVKLELAYGLLLAAGALVPRVQAV